MPIYEFECAACLGRFEQLLRMSDSDPECPACGSHSVRRQLSVFAASTGSNPSGAGGCACGGGGCGCTN